MTVIPRTQLASTSAPSASQNLSERKRMKKSKFKNVYVWTWVADFGKGPELCRFAEASKKILLQNGPPTTDAKPVRVVMGRVVR